MTAGIVLLGAATGTALVSAALTGPLARLLARAGLVDRPNHRSMHDAAIPRGGGAGMVVAVSLAAAVAAAIGFEAGLLPAVGLALGLSLVGFVDDRWNLPSTPRLGAQLLCAVGTVALIDAPSVGPGVGGAAAIAAGLWLLSCCNAVNFMDGVDGITGMITVVAAVHLLVVGDGDALVQLLAALLGGAAAGFLYWNVVRRSVFLGDGGAYFVGTLLAIVVLFAAVRDVPPLVAGAPFAIYLADTGTVLVRRIARREEITKGHRQHVYQQLVLHHGLTHLQSAGVVTVASAACAAAVVAADRGVVPAPVAVVLVAAIGLGYLTAVRWFGLVVRRFAN